MMRAFVFESLSADGATDVEDQHLLAAGRAMRDAVAQDLLRVGGWAVTVAAGPHAAAVPAGTRALAAPRGMTDVEFVAQQSRLHDRTWVIAPETDGVLARLQRAVEPGRWLGCDAASIALAASKRATLAHAAAHGLATPLDFAASPTTRRWVVKPDDGAGALATRVHNTHTAASDDRLTRRERGDIAVLEPWVAGEALSLSLLCGAGRIELLAVNRQQLGIDAFGTLTFVGVQVNALAGDEARLAALRDWAPALSAAFPGLRGYVGVDLVWHRQRGPVLIEINPRVTMAYVGLSAALGRNLAAAVLAAHTQEFADALA
jgi:predicted ATP-grasp superfamily ATP-dependent carboligase